MAHKAELLSPAGDRERLKMAILYGADAVYLAGHRFGMRSSVVNFSDEDLRWAVSYAHARDVKIYVTCNTLPREEELRELPGYLEFLQEAGVDALIIADLGVLELAKRHAPRVARHVSTQFGVINSATANPLYALGADTVVLARETPLEDIRKIRANTPEELRIEENDIEQKTLICPQCGGTYESTRQSVCPYCGAGIVRDTIMSWKFTSISQS